MLVYTFVVSSATTGLVIALNYLLPNYSGIFGIVSIPGNLVGGGHIKADPCEPACRIHSG